VPLRRDVAPGETRELVLPLVLDRGRYTVTFTMVQEVNRWFMDADPAFGASYEFEVKR
jgi:hypothetical protein